MVSSACYQILLVFGVLCGQVTANYNGSDTLILDFMSGLNGDLDNRAQSDYNEGHDYIQARFLPIEVKEFGSVPQIYIEVTINARPVAIYVALVTQNETNKDVIYLTPYNVTDPKKYKHGEFKPEDINNMTHSDFRSNPDCKIIFLSLGNGTFTGVWPDCKYIINQHHPAFTVTFSCIGYILNVPLNVAETPNSVPYIIQRKSARYPLVRSPQGYVGPCGKDG